LKVKDLIKDLQEYNPEAEVKFFNSPFQELPLLSIYSKNIGDLNKMKKDKVVCIDIGFDES
jgi:hypothetical protein